MASCWILPLFLTFVIICDEYACHLTGRTFPFHTLLGGRDLVANALGGDFPLELANELTAASHCNRSKYIASLR